MDARTVGQQAAEPPSNPGREWTEEECKECERLLQEQLNCSGTKGRGKGKGGKSFGGKEVRKGKGGEAVCHWCQKPGHIKKDCKDSTKWKSDKDGQRETYGWPKFKPQDRKNNKGVDSLEAEEGDSYVALGM